MGTVSRFTVVVGLTSDTLCHTRFPTFQFLSQNSARHLSHCGFLQTSLPGSGRNWEYHSRDKLEEALFSIFIQQFLELNSHFLTNFAVSRNHINTFVFHIEVLFFTRDLRNSWCWCWCRGWCAAVQHFVCIHESSIQRPGKTFFIVSLKLPSFTIWNPFVETSISYSFSIKVRWECVGYHSCVQVHFLPFWAFKWKRACGDMCLFTIFTLFNTVPIIIPPVKPPAIAPFVEAPFLMNPQSVSSINLSQFLRFPFAWAFGTFVLTLSSFGFSLILFTLSFAWDWRFTHGPWLALIAFASRLLARVLDCIAISLKMCCITLKNTHRANPMTIFLPDKRERTTSKSRILKPNFSSTYFTTSEFKSSKVSNEWSWK